uniref:Uncharacterized protein n=1 Tax=Rhizophora mucronata TaxID=61149 RepID=A0A2P2MVK9_RHIMU
MLHSCWSSYETVAYAEKHDKTSNDTTSDNYECCGNFDLFGHFCRRWSRSGGRRRYGLHRTGRRMRCWCGCTYCLITRRRISSCRRSREHHSAQIVGRRRHR